MTRRGTAHLGGWGAVVGHGRDARRKTHRKQWGASTGYDTEERKLLLSSRRRCA
jgi:hypothetical protein